MFTLIDCVGINIGISIKTDTLGLLRSDHFRLWFFQFIFLQNNNPYEPIYNLIMTC